MLLTYIACTSTPRTLVSEDFRLARPFDRLRLTGADVKIHIFYTNKVRQRRRSRRSRQRSRPQGYCQMDLKSDRIRIKSNNGLVTTLAL